LRDLEANVGSMKRKNQALEDEVGRLSAVETRCEELMVRWW
jgi:hypothetical protein